MPYTSLAEIERKKALADALRSKPMNTTGRRTDVFSGLAHVLNQVNAGKMDRSAMEAEKANQGVMSQEAAAVIQALQSGQPMPEVTHPGLNEAMTGALLKRTLGADKPSTVAEWEYYKNLPESEQNAYLDMKRSPQTRWLDLGGGYSNILNMPSVPYNLGQAPQPSASQPPATAPQSPAAAPQPTGGYIPKNLKPTEEPDYILGLDKAKRKGAKTAAMEGIGEAIDSARAILNGEVKPTSSGIGSLQDSVAGFFGYAPDGAAEAAKLKAIGGALVSKIPRMEGPQSDKDVDNYIKMAGQIGDDTVPIEVRKAALDAVEYLWRINDMLEQGLDEKTLTADEIVGIR